MPELAEVEHSRRQWDIGLRRRVTEAHVSRPESRIFRDGQCEMLSEHLAGRTLAGSEARGKQMLFEFSGGHWLGIHLGMRGELRGETLARGGSFIPRKHDYLVLRMSGGVVLAFEDQRLFGRVRFHQGDDRPEWWSCLPPSVLDATFTAPAMTAFFDRRRKTPVKAVLLMQERFPGIGNWMADEILWRARIHPDSRAGTMKPADAVALYRAVRWVSRTALRVISDDWSYPASWLFLHRWEPGGTCPRCRAKLDRATIGGRTTAWCPQCQPART